MRRQVLEALLARPELLAAPCRAEPQQLHALAEAIAAATPVVLGVSAGDLRDLRVDEQRLPHSEATRRMRVELKRLQAQLEYEPSKLRV